MVHLRIVVPADRSEKVLDLLEATPSACNLVFLAGAARQAAPATSSSATSPARTPAS